MRKRIEYGGALIDSREVNAILRVIKSQGGRRWTIGPESEAFEKELANVAGMKHAVVTNSGSSALLVAIRALHLPKGSKVIIPAVNFPTAFNAILDNDLVPVVVDVDLKTLNLGIWEVDKVLREYNDVGAVIAVNIAGNPVNLPLLREIIDGINPNVKVVLDDCDGFGTTLDGQMVESFADVACVSFHAAHIITTGEGGAVLTNDEEIGQAARKLREWGRAGATDKIYEYPGFPQDYRERYVYEEIGYNVKPLELQCAMGRVQLKKLFKFKKARRKNYERLYKIFSKNPKFMIMEEISDAETCWFSFPVLCTGIERKKVMDTLEKHNIETRTIFSGNILRHPAYQRTGAIKFGSLQNADKVMFEGMFLSCHPSLTREDIEYIGEVIKGL